MTDTSTTTPATESAPATPEEAAARLAELQQDPAWVDKLLAGSDPKVASQFQTLTEMQASKPAGRFESAMAGSEGRPFEMTDEEHPLTTRQLGGGIKGLREAGLNDDTIRELFSGRKAGKDEYRAVENFMNKLKGDQDWVRRLLAGDHEAKRQLTLGSIVLAAGMAEE
ncbi:MAG TPA: hypothetical protein VFT69_09245 [Pseudolabrys sp.]|nr:hypothetical protein [Pseudolabrys sp.]